MKKGDIFLFILSQEYIPSFLSLCLEKIKADVQYACYVSGNMQAV